MTYQRTPRQTAIGPLGPGSKTAKHYLPDRVEFEPSERVTNATTRERLDLASITFGNVQRVGSADHSRFLSRGTRC